LKLTFFVPLASIKEWCQ